MCVTYWLSGQTSSAMWRVVWWGENGVLGQLGGGGCLSLSMVYEVLGYRGSSALSLYVNTWHRARDLNHVTSQETTLLMRNVWARPSVWAGWSHPSITRIRENIRCQKRDIVTNGIVQDVGQYGRYSLTEDTIITITKIQSHFLICSWKWPIYCNSVVIACFIIFLYTINSGGVKTVM